jgi:hypothetical protein
LSTNGFPGLSEWLPDIFQRDDGTYEVGLDGAGPFPSPQFARDVWWASRAFAQAVAAKTGAAA